MKARVKETGEIVEVMYSHTAKDKGTDIIWYITPRGASFSKKELEFIDTGESLDYWTRLEHTYAGMAMQGLLSNERCWEENADKIAEVVICYAKELVKGLRIERSN